MFQADELSTLLCSRDSSTLIIALVSLYPINILLHTSVLTYMFLHVLTYIRPTFEQHLVCGELF